MSAPSIESVPYLDNRLALFKELKEIQDKEYAAKAREAIKITLPDKTVKEGTSYETTPMEIARNINKRLAERAVIARVNNELWDLERPLESDASLEILDFDSQDGKNVFWHSSAHILGEAAELHYNCHLCIGPPIKDGFYYEMALPNKNVISQADYGVLEDKAKQAIKEKQPFERLVLSKENLLKMFAYNKYKVHIIKDKIPDGSSTTVYRCGPLIDLCRGPHVPHTGRINSFAIMKNSSSYFLGDNTQDVLQRVYGISFPDKKLMVEYKKFLEEAAKRDHRKIGKEQELFFFSDMSPGSPFFLPHGVRIYNALLELIREEYRKRGFTEVMSPTMYNSALWKQSGHWENYAEDMFQLRIEKEDWALKPMNCPGHCLMFGMRERSYRELPIRFADFSVLHRNEASGALTGLSRVRRFCQDDAHIFCMQSQVTDEVKSCFDFLKTIYSILGFKFAMALSTMPEKHLGSVETWKMAEAQLEEAMNSTGEPWEYNHGDGAFYGPKIDIYLEDALKRRNQCATIQLDFQLPQRFELEYRSAETTQKDGEAASQLARPVMIHRAILGSVERMISMLSEHFAGKWPFWLSPRQVMVIPVTGVFFEFAQAIKDRLWDAGFYADVDLGPETLPKKTRSAQLAQYNFILVVGQEEKEANAAKVRARDVKETGRDSQQLIPVDDLIAKLKTLKSERRLENTI